MLTGYKLCLVSAANQTNGHTRHIRCSVCVCLLLNYDLNTVFTCYMLISLDGSKIITGKYHRCFQCNMFPSAAPLSVTVSERTAADRKCFCCWFVSIRFVCFQVSS